MRPIRVILLACGLSLVCAAQTNSVKLSPPGVNVSGFEWRTLYRTVREAGKRKQGDYAWNDPMNPARTRTPDGKSHNPEPLEIEPPPVSTYVKVFDGYESSVLLQNSGAKTITAVEWEHVFFADKDKQSEVRRFRFRKEEKIEPGEQKFVAQRLNSNRHSSLPPQPRQGVVIDRIEYSDGTFWQRQ